MIITISGIPGSGKSRIAKMLAKKLNYKFYSVGNFQGELAKEKGLTITEMMTLEKNHPEIHKQVDEKTKKLGKTQDNFIVDGWIAYHFIPHSYKIFLDVNELVGANRIFKGNKRNDEPKKKDIKSTLLGLRYRLKETREGFENAHEIDFLNSKNYDYLLDTTNLTPKQVIKNILKQINKNEN